MDPAQYLSTKDQVSTTPQFLIWALSTPCAIKSTLECTYDSPDDLLKLERTFRPLRSIALATAEGRRAGDLCIMQNRKERPDDLDQVKGFYASEILAAFGEQEYLDAHCGNCPANVYRAIQQPTGVACQNQFAGCYGYLQSEYDGFELFEWVQLKLDNNEFDWDRPTGFQLDEIWRVENDSAERVLSRSDMEWLRSVLSAVSATRTPHSDWTSLNKAIEHALETDTNIQLHVVPKARIINRNWIVPQHCSSCIHPIEEWQGHCPHCKSNSPPNSMRKRQLRGDRPFWPIVRFLGQDKAQEFADEYFDQEMSQRKTVDE